ncbi:MAG: lipoprotein insertase outer membrane protein LolB, partial [Wenzhouxiangella sp.]
GFVAEGCRKDGSKFYFSESAWPVHDAAGNLAGYEGIIEDTSDKRRVEESLRESERRYRIVSELTSDMVYAYAIDADGRPLEILQSGWAIEYTEFEEVDGVSMPVAMVLEREEVELRARIGRWQLGKH